MALFTVTTAIDENDGGTGGSGLSLREALTLANTNPGLDNIIFNPQLLTGQTITLTLGELVIADHLNLMGLGANNLTVNGNNQSRVFTIDDGNSSSPLLEVAIEGLTISGGSTASDGGGLHNNENLTLSNVVLGGNSAGNDGGGLYNLGMLTVSNSTFLGNSASNDGGSLSNQGTLTVSNSTFLSNSANNQGGGLFDLGMATISESNFTNNAAGSRGGGFFSGGTAVVSDSIFTGNTAVESGGGLYNGQTLNITGSTFSGNSASSNGGGLYNSGDLTISDSNFSSNNADLNGGGIFSIGTATVSDSTLSSNTAGQDGGGFSNQGNSSISNSTFNDNVAGNNGGGISNNNGGFADLSQITLSSNTAVNNGGGLATTNGSETDLSNSTVTLNQAASGDGLFNQGATTTATSTIVAGNDGNQDLGGNFTSGGHNLIGNGGGGSGFTNGVNNDLVGTAVSPIDPRLVPLADNGGPTQTHALFSDSPAINGGSNPDNLTNDQRGVGFTRESGAEADIGSYELQANIDIQKLVQIVASASGIPMTDLCENGKPSQLSFRYTGGSGNQSVQGTSKSSVTGDPMSAPLVRILATDDDDPFKSGVDVFFEGQVELGEEFTIDTANAGTSFSSNTYLHLLDLNNNLLQTVKYHTSCSAPIVLNDVIGGVTLTGYVSEDGLSFQLPTPTTTPPQDADEPTGPIAVVGNNDQVLFSYVVTNPTNNTSLSNVAVSDDNETPGDPSDDFNPDPILDNGFNIGDTNRNNRLEMGEEWRYEASQAATLGQHTSVGRVTAQVSTGEIVLDSDPANYLGIADSNGAIRIEKLTNGQEANTPPGIPLPIGTPVTWTYQVYNDGNTPLTITEIVDDAGSPGNLGDDFQPAPVLNGSFNVGDLNQNEQLDLNEIWQYTSEGVVSYQAEPAFEVSLGQAANFGLLVLAGGKVANFKPKDSAVVGDIGYSQYVEAKDNELKGSATLTGTVYVDTTAIYEAKDNFQPSGGVIRNTTANTLLSQANTDALSASTQFAALPASQQFPNKIENNLTIYSNGEVNVIKIDELELKDGEFLTLDGRNGFNDYFVFNVVDLNNSGKTKFKLDGGQIRLVDVSPERVLFNFPIEAGQDIPNDGDIELKNFSVAFGTFLAPAEKFKVDKGTLTGAVISQEFEVNDDPFHLTYAPFLSQYTNTVQVTAEDNGMVVTDEASSSHYGIDGGGIPLSDRILIGDNITDVVANQFNIALVIDVSGSMAWAFNGSTNPPAGQSRLDFAKDAFKEFLDTSIFDSGIAANSVIRIAPFNGSFPTGDSRSPQTFNPNDYGTLAEFQTALNQKIDSLFAQGATQYEPPLRQTGQWFQSSEAIEQSEATNKIYFLSDGYDNDGYNIGSDAGLNNLYNGNIPHFDIQAFGFGADGINSFRPDELDLVELGNGPVPPDVPTNWQTNDRADVAVVVNDDPSKLTDELTANSVSDAPTDEDTIVGGMGDEIIFGDNLIMDAASKAAFEATPEADQPAFLANYIQNTLLPGGANFDSTLFDLNQSIGQSDDLAGGAGADIIFAQGGDDAIAGGEGNDLLVGGDGVDTFAYQSLGDGVDTIVDFENGIDLIALNSLGVTAGNFNTRVSISAIGSDTQVSVDGNLLATLTGISSGIEQSDFILAV